MGVNNECRQAIELLAETLFPATHQLMDADDVAVATLTMVTELRARVAKYEEASHGE